MSRTVEASRIIREQMQQRSIHIDRKDDKWMEQLVEEANNRSLKGQQHDK